MTHTRFRLLSSANRAQGALLVCVALTCSAPGCSDSKAHPSMISSNGGEIQAGGGGHAGVAAGGSGGKSGSANGGDAGAAGSEEDQAGATGDGGAAPQVPAVCSPTATWGSPTVVDAVSSAMAETLLSMTPDELDLAFVRASALYVAHRAVAGAAFNIGLPVPIPSGWSFAQGAALSADGKRLVLVSDPDQRKLGELTRTSRIGAFSSTIDETAFSRINQDATYTGRLYASPVVSAGDDQLFFNSSFPEAASTVVVSTRSGAAAWTPPMQLSDSVLDGGAGARRLPTGVSADARTLFYFNEESHVEEARFRDTSQTGSPLSDMLPLGMRRGATPNSGCDRLYSESNSDVVVEKD